MSRATIAPVSAASTWEVTDHTHPLDACPKCQEAAEAAAVHARAVGFRVGSYTVTTPEGSEHRVAVRRVLGPVLTLEGAAR